MINTGYCDADGFVTDGHGTFGVLSGKSQPVRWRGGDAPGTWVLIVMVWAFALMAALAVSIILPHP